MALITMDDNGGGIPDKMRYNESDFQEDHARSSHFRKSMPVHRTSRFPLTAEIIVKVQNRVNRPVRFISKSQQRQTLLRPGD